MERSNELIERLGDIQFALYCVLGALVYLGGILTAMLQYAKKKGQTLVTTEGAKEFHAQAQELLRKADYKKLKEVGGDRQAAYPGDSTVQYYLGMAHLRCQEYVEAKGYFEHAMRLDAQWKKLCTTHLSEIEGALKKAKPTLVQ